MLKITFNLLFGEFILQNNKRHLIGNSPQTKLSQGRNGKEMEVSCKQSSMVQISMKDKKSGQKQTNR